MQHVSRLSTRNLFRLKIHYLNYLHRQFTINNEHFQRCLKHDQTCHFIGSITQNTLKQFQRKYRAIHSMLIDGCLIPTCNKQELDYCRYFSNGSVKLNKTNSDGSNNSSDDFDKNRQKKNEREEKEKRLVQLKFIIALGFFYTLTAAILSLIANNAIIEENEQSRVVSWNEFVHQFLSKGEVKEVIVIPEIDAVQFKVHDNAIIKGRKSVFSVYRMFVPDVIKVEERIREAERNLGIKPELGVPVIYQRPHFSGIVIILLGILIAIFWRIFSRLPQMREFPPKFYSHMTQAKFTLVDPLTGKGKGIRFSDVAGLREAKIEVMEFVDYLKRPENYKVLGAKIPKGTLLLGPPGCGKTLLAKAVATEANVPFLSMNGSEFTEVVGGLGAARIRDLFKEAKKRAPSIIYIDEIDTIGTKRLDTVSSRTASEHEQTLNQLLTEMDGMVSRQDVIVLASTNRSEVLDKALLRAGRFDRHILIDLPNLVERQEIFELHLKKINLDQDPSVYSAKLAAMTPRCSGADIANVCNEAALHAARTVKKKVESEDLWWAVDRVMNGSEKINKTVLEKEKRIIAYHEAGHIIASWMLENMENIHKVSIVQRTNSTFGYGVRITERTLYSKEYLEDLMCTCMAGRVAETLTFNLTTTNGQNDLERVTEIAYNLVRKFGMNKTVGLIAFTEDQLSDKSHKIYSKTLGDLMDAEVRSIVIKVYKRCEKLLIENKDKLKLLAEALLDKETLTFEEVEQIIGPRNLHKHQISLKTLPVTEN